MGVIALGLIALVGLAAGVSPDVKQPPVMAPDAHPQLRGMNMTLNPMAHVQGASVPCQCETQNMAWVKTTRTVPKCIFIDLGAANGNSFNDFLNNKYGPVANCPSGQWEATLVEANPRFDSNINNLAATYPGTVHSEASHAAYMCEGQTSFYLDTVNHGQNYWGSSMSANHPDTQKSGHTKVTVPTVNVNRMVYETTIPADYVILKMDIEGAEWDVLPCLAQAPGSSLIDRLLVEIHPGSWGNIGTTQHDLDVAKATLRTKGVDVPDYFSQTL